MILNTRLWLNSGVLISKRNSSEGLELGQTQFCPHTVKEDGTAGCCMTFTWRDMDKCQVIPDVEQMKELRNYSTHPSLA